MTSQTAAPESVRQLDIPGNGMTKRILIVDDSALIRGQVRRILESQAEIEVCDEAVNGAEAVRKVNECHPDLVVLDVIMPVMNGLDAARAIKKLSPGSRVLLFTLDESAEITREGKRAGADAILSKSHGTELNRIIHGLLE
jgi:DNA-binding NarL/FixJ family response regulator